MVIRKVKGATSGLAVILTITLAMVGVGTLYLVQAFSGSRQVTTAVDAGNLNVAVAAALVPSIPLASSTNTLGLSTQQVQIETQIQAALGNDPSTGSPYNVNLLNINKVIGYGFMIAMNAAAEATPTGIANAQAVHDVIEGSASSTIDGTGTSFAITSITNRLKAALQNPSTNVYENTGSTQTVTRIGPLPPGVPRTITTTVPATMTSNGWVQYFFNQGASANPQGLANSASSATWQSGSFQTAYLGIGDASNIVASTLANNLPYTDIDAGKRLQITIPQTKDGYIPGYTKINIPGTNINYYFVTNYGDQNPGLRSNYEFNLGKSQPGAGSVTLPPNTFLNQGSITLAKLNSSGSGGGTTNGSSGSSGSGSSGNGGGSGGNALTLNQTSIATIGTKAFPPAVPIIPGYIVVDNTPQMTYTGPFPGACDNVVCDELGTAIYVLSSQAAGGNGLLFSLNGGLLNNIAAWWNAGGYNNSAPVTSAISSALAAGGEANNLYNYSNAAQITSSTLQSTLTSQVGNSMISFGLLVCTDQVSDPNDPNDISQCANEVPTFNAAYHPNASKASANANVSGLTAAEMAKDTFYQGFWQTLLANNLITLGQASNLPTIDQFIWHAGSGSIMGFYDGFTFTISTPYVSGLGMYYSDANPVSTPTANIPWGTDGVYGTAVNASSNASESSSATGGIDELGQTYCCGGKDWVDPKRMGKITQLLTLPGILFQTATVNSTYPKYTEQVNNGTSTVATQYANPTVNSPAVATYNWFMQRCGEMGLNLTNTAQFNQATNLWNTSKIDIGETAYFYMSNGNLVCSNSNTNDFSTTTAGVNVINNGALLASSYPAPNPNASYYPTTSAVTANIPPVIDGRTYAYSQQYNLLYNVVNAEYDFNIEEYMYYGSDNGCVVASDYVYVQSATGAGAAYGCLGRIVPRERVDNGPGPSSLPLMQNLENSWYTDLTKEGLESGQSLASFKAAYLASPKAKNIPSGPCTTTQAPIMSDEN